MRAVFLVLALGLTACQVNDYCINCDDDGDDAGDDDSGTIDARASDGGGPIDACIPDGNDADCNGLDNDCDGHTDEGFDFGGACGTDVGDCTAGVKDCVGGVESCSGDPGGPESCDDADNDCDGNTDEGNPEGGADCGSDVGECQGGTTTCVGGVVDCVGDIGIPGQNPEVCDAKDNDCDTFFDEGVTTAGDCGFTDVGLCEPGTLTCVGGDYLCVGGHGPSIELCDVAEEDQDCDGFPHNGYTLDSDVANCGQCGHSCVGTIDNATERCTGGACAVASCDTDFHDDPTHAGQDCDYFCQFAGSVEACNQVDDDCDHNIDENLSAPPICDQDGECAGTVATCTVNGYACDYGPTVSTDANGDIEPEQACDGLDNDCDGVEDDSFPTLDDDCDGAGDGVCQEHGHITCDPADPLAPPICTIDDFGGTSSAEVCDDLDNDCDGNTDENPGTLQNWVSIGGGRQIMKYEASRPDAKIDELGINSTYPCSRAGVQPWTMVTQPQAEAACALVGARLCTEQEWHRACSVVTGTTFPVDEPAGSNGYLYFEAEDYYGVTPRTSGTTIRSWVPDYSPGYYGISAMRASPNSGANVSQANAPLQAPRLDFKVNFTTTGNHFVWVRTYRNNTNDDGVRVGINVTRDITSAVLATNVVTITTSAAHGFTNGTVVHIDGVTNTLFNGTYTITAVPSTTTFRYALTAANTTSSGGTAFVGGPTTSVANTADVTWEWRVSGSIAVAATGNRMVSLWMLRDGVKVDAIVISRVNNVTPTETHGNGGDWSFASSPDVFVNDTCNGDENDTDPSTIGVDEDSILATGAKASCFANQAAGGVFDLSGNVKEWTSERTPNVNPFRGGASNNLSGGTMCSNAFSLANDSFFFNNVGFRCCK